MDKFLSKKEVSDKLSISTETLRKLMNSKKIPYYKTGTSKSSRVRFKESDIKKYLKSIKK